MKLLAGIVWSLLLVGAYWIGANDPLQVEPASNSIASFEAALDHRNPLSRSFEISRYLRTLDAHSVDDTLRVVEAAGFWFDQQEHQLLLAAWVPIDSDAAVTWALARPKMLRDRASSAALEALGFHDPPRAQYVLLSLDDPELVDFLHLYMVRGWARADRRDELTDYLIDLPPSVSRQGATTALANEILKGGPDALIAWVDSIEADPSHGFKRVAFQNSANALSQTDPARAARWIDDHLGRPYTMRVPYIVARNWAEQDPAAAMSWLVSLPEESKDADRTKTVFTPWLDDDTQSAEYWVRSAEPSTEIDALIRVIIRRYFDRRPDLAMEWAHLLNDPAVRTRVKTSVGRAWYRKNRDAFMAWLPESGLESQVRDLILNTPMAP